MNHAAVINCVICFNPNISLVTGHVHKDGEKIIAKFCKEHKNTPCLDNGCKGCSGEWKSEMGFDETFGQVVSIG